MATSPMTSVLILDANQRSALAATRSLGKHQVTVCTADEATTALAGTSRYSSQYFTYPSPRQQPDAFISRISDLISQHDIGMLLPMTELTIELLTSAQDRLPCVILPFPDPACVNKLSNKCNLLETAQQLGIPVPKYSIICSPEQALQNLSSQHYPLVLKPGKSWISTNGKWWRAAVRIADSAASCREIIQSDSAFQEHTFMLQQYISGHGAGIFAIYNHGSPVAFFAHKRLREKPPQGGVSVLSESTQINQQMLKHTRNLLDSVGWHGVAMVEFKVTVDGTPYLMEVNTRFWGSLQLAIDAGVDFPWLLYLIATSQPAKITEHYQTGIRLRWLLGDLDSLYLTLRDKRSTFGHKLKSSLQFFTPSFKTRHEINRLHDMAPAWLEIRQYLQDIFR